jgi:hypothetical protein
MLGKRAHFHFEWPAMLQISRLFSTRKQRLNASANAVLGVPGKIQTAAITGATARILPAPLGAASAVLAGAWRCHLKDE